VHARKLTARGQQRREELLLFATSAFAEKGFHATSVHDIVTGLGVGKGVFYWYFQREGADIPSGEDLGV